MENESISNEINQTEQEINSASVENEIKITVDYERSDNKTPIEEKSIEPTTNSIKNNIGKIIDDLSPQLFPDSYKKDPNNDGVFILKTDDDLKADKEKEDNKFVDISNQYLKILFNDPRLKHKLNYDNKRTNNSIIVYNYINNCLNDNDINDLTDATIEITKKIDERQNAQICPYHLIIGAIRRKVKDMIKEHNKNNPHDIRYFKHFSDNYDWGRSESTLAKMEYASKIFDHGNYEKYYRYGYVHIGKLVTILDGIKNKDNILENIIEDHKNLQFFEYDFQNSTRFVNFFIIMHIDLKDYPLDFEVYKKLYDLEYELTPKDVKNIKNYSYIENIANIYAELLLKANGNLKKVVEALNKLPNPGNNRTINLIDAIDQYKKSNNNNTSSVNKHDTSDKSTTGQSESANVVEQNTESQQDDTIENKETSDVASEVNLKNDSQESQNATGAQKSSAQEQLQKEQEAQPKTISSQSITKVNEKNSNHSGNKEKREETYEYLITSLHDNLNNYNLDLMTKSQEIQKYTEDVVKLLLYAINKLKNGANV